MSLFVGLWGALSVACLFVAVFQPNRWVRAAWAVVIAAGTAVGFAFRHATVAGADEVIE